MFSIHWVYVPFALFLLAAAPLLADAVMPADQAETSGEKRPAMRGHVMRPSDKAPVFVTCDAADPACVETDAKP